MTTLRDAFFEDLARHIDTWRTDSVDALGRGRSATWSEHPDSYDRLRAKGFSETELQALADVMYECLRGVVHSTLVTIDGGTIMSETGAVALLDTETLQPLANGSLHEEFMEFLASRDLL